MKKSVIVLLVLLGLATIGAVLWSFIGGKKATQVEVVMPVTKTLVETVTASGKIQPEVEVKVTTEVSGQIIELPVKEGDNVKKGDLLVQINPDIYESALDRANAALNQSRSSLASAKSRLAQARAQFVASDRAYQRSVTLFEQGAISQADYDQALSGFEVASAEIEASQEAVKSAEFQILSSNAGKKEAADNLSRTTLVAPQDGTVTALTKEVGESVLGTSMMQGETIMKVSNLSNMEVNVEVNESDIVKVSVGDTAVVEVDAYLDQEFKGVVTEISNTALNALDGMLSMDQVTNFSVKIRILPESYNHLFEGKTENFSPFRPGMSATVEIATKRQTGIAVPIRAVATRTDTSSVSKRRRGPRRKASENEDYSVELEEPILVVFTNNGGTAKLHEVKTGIQDSEYIIIESGISLQDEIITGPYEQVSRSLKSGESIEVEEERKFKNE